MTRMKVFQLWCIIICSCKVNCDEDDEFQCTQKILLASPIDDNKMQAKSQMEIIILLRS